ncbi:MAG TPA: hypothetical protein DIS66_03460 [Candidatus Omnitrophica bacterium]|nr:hypothetical protein [Candidatus Omnitrophota bacterium]
MSQTDRSKSFSDPEQGLFKKADLIIHSSDLFETNGLVLIKHGDEWYQLRRTRHNRLILNK